MTKQLPNIFTLLNLVFGCMAILVTLQNGITIQYAGESGQFIDVPEKIWLASLFIGLAGVVDFLDGFVARLFKATSPIGAQLDSLADVVSFGVAPSMILYQFLRLSFASGENGIEVPVIYLMPVFILAAAAAYRLARFNVNASETVWFSGVPTPAVGMLIASFPLIYWHSGNEWVLAFLLNKWVLYTMVLLLSWLMVSRIPLLSFKMKSYGLKENLPVYLLLAYSLLFSMLMGWLAVPFIFVAYIVLSLIFIKRQK